MYLIFICCNNYIVYFSFWIGRFISCYIYDVFFWEEIESLVGLGSLRVVRLVVYKRGLIVFSRISINDILFFERGKSEFVMILEMVVMMSWFIMEFNVDYIVSFLISYIDYINYVEGYIFC